MDAGTLVSTPARSLGAGGRLAVGFVNNMAPSAMLATERQFRVLLDNATQGYDVQLRLFALPGAAQLAADGTASATAYEDLDALWDAKLDGLIVTGAEPRAVAMTEEPSWPVMSRLVDWARVNTASTIWSCLAAHAAVYRLDGVDRILLPRKLSGVYVCDKASDHVLTRDAPRQWRVPHSRFNALAEPALLAAGYTILSHSSPVGPDMFAKDAGSLFVFVQGHLEYDADTLLREYRRDVRRYIAGVWDRYPDMPEGYFDSVATATLLSLRETAQGRDGHDVNAAFDAAMASPLPHDWHAHGVRLIRRWLGLLAERKTAAAAAAIPS
jgi:homoserine O-succinyltransferase